MSVSLLWHCDDCGAELVTSFDAPRALCTPDGWLSRRDGDGWLLLCPECARKDQDR